MTDLRQIAYNAGLEIRYAVSTSGLDPIQHIPEVDAIIERRLAECRRGALEEAAKIAEDYALDAQPDREYALACNDLIEKFRALSHSTPTPLQEQNANSGKERE